jgi:hypothetical protein
MNIFVLDKDPTLAAQYHCDKHVVKMVLESAQMLSATHTLLDGEQDGLYKLTHANHPCTKWVRESNNNYNWMYALFSALCAEYTFRYGKTHLCQTKFLNKFMSPPKNISIGYKTIQPKAMPVEFQVSDVVQSYRNYYKGAKADIAKWKVREAPEWFKND